MKKHARIAVAALSAALSAAQLAAAPGAERRAECEARARALVEQLTPAECVKLLMMDSPAIERLGIPAFHWWNEALHGYARSGRATVFPQGIGAAATFDDDLEFRTAEAIATEARAKRNLSAAKGRRGRYRCLSIWSPNINLFRDPRWGRGQETFGEDPFLTAAFGKAFVRGLQGDDPKYFKAVACAKHFAVHSGPEAKRHEFNVNIDRRDLNEFYLYAFKALVTEAGVESVMGAYSAINGVPCCANSFLLKDVLRGEWGFKGTVVSDVGAVRDVHKFHHYAKDALGACLATIEGGLDICSEDTYNALLKAVKEGRVTKDILVEPLVRALTTRVLLGDLDPDGSTPWDGLGAADISTDAHRALALEAAEKSLVLVKNNGVLPVDPDSLGVVTMLGRGNDVSVLLGSYNGLPADPVTVTSAFIRELDPSVLVYDEPASDLTIVCVGMSTDEEDETNDRTRLSLAEPQLKLLRDARKRKPKAKIVTVVFGAGSLDLREVCELSDAVILAWYPGEQGGMAIARTILGKANRFGRLPVSYYATLEGLGDIEDYSLPGRTYRYGAKCHWPFGYGLSYTTFGYGAATAEKRPDGSVEVSVGVSNTGKREGDEIVQLYVRSPEGSGDRRLHHLEGFKRVTLAQGETKRVTFTLAPDQFAQFAPDGSQTLATGEYTIFCGGGQPGLAPGAAAKIHLEATNAGPCAQMAL